MLKIPDLRAFCRFFGRAIFASVLCVFSVISFVCADIVRPEEPKHTIIYDCGNIEGGVVDGVPPGNHTCYDDVACQLYAIGSSDNPCHADGYEFDYWYCTHAGLVINYVDSDGGVWNNYFNMHDYLNSGGNANDSGCQGVVRCTAHWKRSVVIGLSWRDYDNQPVENPSTCRYGVAGDISPITAPSQRTGYEFKGWGILNTTTGE